MDVKPGYKQTEVGVLPEDWVVATVGQISEVKTGPFGSALHERDYVDDGTPIITVEHLGECGVHHLNLPMVSASDKSRLIAYSLKQGDIVFSRVGSVDRNALIKPAEDGWLFSGRLLRVRLKHKDIDASYLSFHFHSEAFKQRVRDVAVGQTMASINTQILMGVKTILPPTKSEQRAVAAALSDVDALLAAQDRLIAKKRDIKHAAMQELLTGKRRLPGFEERNGHKQTEMGLIPGDWAVKAIKDIAGVKGGKRLPLGKSFSEKVTNHPYIRVADMYSGSVILDDIKYVPDDVFPTIRNYCISIEDIFISVAGTLGIIGKIPHELDGANLTENADKITNIRCNRDFLQYNLISERIQSSIESEKTVGAQPKLAINRIQNFKIALPPDTNEQSSIASVLSDMDAEIAALEARREKTRALKQGMMQELLTGRIRLV